MNYFWATDMVILRDLEMETVVNSIHEMVDDNYIEDIFSFIGTPKEIFGLNYDELKSEA
jgi:hypothetical protein